MAMYTLLYLKATRTYGIAQGTLLIAMGSLDGRGVWGRMDTCVYIYMAESLDWAPETITTLLIGYTPKKNKKLKKKKDQSCIIPKTL